MAKTTSADTSPAPTIGRLVHYRLSAEDALAINGRREDARLYRHARAKGTQVHVGKPVSEGQTVTLVVTAVHGPSCVNGHLLLDGSDSLGVTSRSQGDQPGTWAWPARG